ncbi:MAG TPA: hypothetical protein VF062_10570 [Candidatus Limnocylindrales bacterium]
MSHPNGEQAEPQYPAAASQPPPASFEQAAAQFTAAAPVAEPAPAQAPAPAPAQTWAQTPAQTPAPATEPALAGVVLAPAAQPAFAAGTAEVPPPPTAAFPVTGVPVSGYPIVKSKQTGKILLIVATVVLGLATAGLGTMYYLEAGARGKADKKVIEQAAALETAGKKLTETQTQLSTSKEENAKLTQDLTGAKNKTDEVTKARDALIACMQAIDAFDAAQNNATAKDLIVKCTEAEKYY